MEYVEFDKQKFKAFKKRYLQAVAKSEEQFTFEGNEYLRAYAKYMIEYLETKFKN